MCCLNSSTLSAKSAVGIFRIYLRSCLAFFLLLMPAAVLNQPLFANETGKETPIGLNERLGHVVNLDYTFFNEQGESVRLRDLVDRPTILNFVYYNCPGICTPVLSELQNMIDKVDLEPGKDYRILTISINEDETPELAARKKANYVKGLKRPFPEEYWTWMTGDSASIKGITDEVGFVFRRTGNDFAHPASLMVLSKSGKIARYLPGVAFNQFDVKMALLEASEGRVGPTIATVIKFCFSYDPAGRKYVFNFLKVVATLMIVFAVGFVVLISLTSKRRNDKETS